VRLQGKRVLITGAGHGLGKAIALYLGRQGAEYCGRRGIGPASQCDKFFIGSARTYDV